VANSKICSPIVLQSDMVTTYCRFAKATTIPMSRQESKSVLASLLRASNEVRRCDVPPDKGEFEQ
jgi:hypothetical protein